MTLSFRQLKKEFRILIREDPIGDLKEFYLLMSTSQILSRFVDPLSFLSPKKSDKKAVTNDDDQCFKWSVTRSLNPVEKNSERITKELKDQSKRLDWSGLKFPVKLDQIVIFEKFNPSISINVFGFEGDVYPLRLSKTKSERIVNLLLVSDGEKQHYCLINSLSRLLSSQMSKHDHANSFCLNCLNHFPNEKKLKIHEEYCLKNQAIKI